MFFCNRFFYLLSVNLNYYIAYLLICIYVRMLYINDLCRMLKRDLHTNNYIHMNTYYKIF